MHWGLGWRYHHNPLHYIPHVNGRNITDIYWISGRFEMMMSLVAQQRTRGPVFYTQTPRRTRQSEIGMTRNRGSVQAMEDQTRSRPFGARGEDLTESGHVTLVCRFVLSQVMCIMVCEPI